MSDLRAKQLYALAIFPEVLKFPERSAVVGSRDDIFGFFPLAHDHGS